MSIKDFFSKEIKKNILNKEEYSGNHSLMASVDYRADKDEYKHYYTTEQIAYLFDHRLLEEYVKTGASWERGCSEYWQFTDKGKTLREWYNRLSIWNYLYYKLHIFMIKHKWQRLRIKMGHHYAWQDYKGVDLDSI